MGMRWAVLVLAALLMFASTQLVLVTPSVSARQDDGGQPSSGNQLMIRTIDLEDSAVSGACFTAVAVEGPDWEQTVCDNGPGDHVRRGGRVEVLVPAEVGAVSVEMMKFPVEYQPVGMPFFDRVEMVANTAEATFVVASPEQRAPFIPPPPSEPGGCDFVELYPGYPGYRGFVTGLDGIGDHACVQDLVAQTPGFDRAAFDRAHILAAQRIGLGGAPNGWTWENWMAIEAELGLPPTCYSCALQQAPYRAEPIGTGVAWDDPRLLIGSFGTTIALDLLLASEHPIPRSALRSIFNYDHDLRMAVGMFNAGRHLTAAEVWNGYRDILDIFQNGRWFDGQVGVEVLFNQGGYAPTPPTASVEDQIFMIEQPIGLLARTTMDPMGASAYMAVFENSTIQWLSSTLDDNPSQRTSFADWLRQGAANPAAP